MEFTNKHAAAIYTPGNYYTLKTVKVVGYAAIALTGYRVADAFGESLQTSSVKPITAQIVREAGGWGGAWLGSQAGALAGASCGIALGPLGSAAAGGIGGFMGGIAGYWSAD